MKNMCLRLKINILVLFNLMAVNTIAMTTDNMITLTDLPLK